MGTLIATYSESKDRFFRLARKDELTIEGVRRVLGSSMRYCLGDRYLYIPGEDPELDELGQLCWARIPADLIYEYKFNFGDRFEGSGDLISGLSNLEEAGVRIGNRYIRRQKEVDGKFVAVPEFCSQALIDALAANPETLPAVSHLEFENLCAEIFARRGFSVDLFRGSGDGGIDFLALKDEKTDPVIFAVQCKQPEERPGKGRRSVGRPVVQQIYGAAKAWDMKGGIVISGSTYSPQAKKFADQKPDEMKVYDESDLLEWITQFRWNEDETV